MCVRFCMDAALFAWENIASSAASNGHTQLIAEDVKLKLLLTLEKKTHTADHFVVDIKIAVYF
jgi:hypothetical protein